eukprot:c27435_g1_i2 orf=1424-2353(-)
MLANQFDSAQMSFSTHHSPEEEGERFEDGVFSEDGNFPERELRSPVEGRDSDSIVGREMGPLRQLGIDAAGSKTELAPALGLANDLQSSKPVMLPAQIQVHPSTACSFPAKPKAASESIDIICAQNENSAKVHRQSCKKMHSVRESLLEEAWERKRDHILHNKLNNTEKPRLEKIGRSVSLCGKGGRLQGQVTDRLSRMRSLTDDDFDELRGCIDLGFRFTQTYIPDLCETLPALGVCYAITQTLHDSQPCLSPVSTSPGILTPSPGSSSSESPNSSWQICSPGENPQKVKARLRHWAQAVACTVRQSS